MPWAILADAILLTHASFVAFVVVGFALTLAGLWRGWVWIRNPWFRGLHLAAILYVVLQSWIGVACPLTVLENRLRVRAGQSGYEAAFIQDWVSRLLYYDAEPWVFTVVYTVFGAAVLATWWLVRPHRDGNRRVNRASG